MGVQSKFKDIQSFLRQYAPKEIADHIKFLPPIRTSNDFNIIRYNWTLNGNITDSLCESPPRICIPFWYIFLAQKILPQSKTQTTLIGEKITQKKYHNLGILPKANLHHLCETIKYETLSSIPPRRSRWKRISN